MNRLRKRILSVLFALAIIVTSIGVYLTDSFPMSRVNAASNPEYMAKIDDAKDNQVRKSILCEANTTYTFTCNYYFKSEGTPYMRMGFVASAAMGGEQAHGTGEYDARLVNSKNTVGTVIVKYKTPETLPSDNWLNIYFVVTSNVEAEFYIWNVKVCKGNSSTNIVNNADFTQQASDEKGGSWIGWSMSGYESYKYINDVDKSEAAKSSSLNTIVKYDLETYEFLPDYTLEPNYDWDNANKKLTFSDEDTFNLSTITDYHLYKEGYVFVGWKSSDSGWLTSTQVTMDTTFAKDEVLTAEYVECSRVADGDFAIRGEEIRTDDMGLRFIVEMSNSLRDTLEVTEYGTLVLPSDVLDNDTNGWSINVLEPNDYGIEQVTATGWSDLTYNGSYTYNGNTYTPEIVEAKNIYQTLGDRVYYTLCITNITEAKYDRQYTVKGYAKYTDENGVERILYTDYASTNPYIVSGDMIEAGSVDGTAKESLQSLVNTVQTKYQDARDTMEEGRVSLADDATAVPTNQVFDSTKLGSGESFYKLSNNLRVRELVIGDKDASNEVEIIQLSDMHYNYFNALDGAQPTARLLLTMKNRTWGEKGAHTTQGRTLLEYARTADATVITGDIMDYLAYGTEELMKREVWDRYPNTLISIGNHEFSQKTDEKMADTLSPEARWNWISKAWAMKHDYNYTSKVIKNKVMIVQLNNGDNTFYQDQVTQLERDLETARREGYVVLLFMHEPLVTGNAADTAVTPILTGDYNHEKPYDFYTGKRYSNVYPEINEDTKNMFELIKTNADVIQGVFNGHIHTSFYTEIQATTPDEIPKVIPQYTVHASAFNSGYAMKIKVKY